MLRKILVVTLLISLMTACAPQATPTTAPLATEIPATEALATQAATESAVANVLTFTDGLGREITLSGPAQHVVSLAPSNTEILFAIGAGDQVVGRDALSDFPEAAKNVTDVGSTFDSLNTEQ